jgi:hypothetical protein
MIGKRAGQREASDYGTAEVITKKKKKRGTVKSHS